MSKHFLVGIIISFLFILFPVLFLPAVFVEIYNKRRYAFLLLAIFMGLLSMFYYPQGDQYRYMYDLANYRYYSIDELFSTSSVLAFRNINIINIALYFASKFCLTLEQFRFLLIVFSYLVMFNLFNKLNEKYFLKGLTHDKHFTIFIIYFLSIPFYYICYGFRAGLGACFLTCGICYFIMENRFKAILFLILASFSHFFYYFYLFIIPFLSCFRRNIKIKKVLLLCLSIFLLFITPLLIAFFYGKNDFIDLMIDVYIKGEWGTEFVWNRFNLMERFLVNGFVAFICYYIIFKFSKSGRFENIIYINFLLIVCSIPFYTLNGRFLMASIPIAVIYILCLLGKGRLLLLHKILIGALCISFIYPYWRHRDAYRYSNIEKMLYMPIPAILQNTYILREVNMNVNPDGNMDVH